MIAFIRSKWLLLCWLGCPAWLVGSAPLALAQNNTRFPYEATVLVDGEQVRSGPGAKFYATAKLHAGDTVTVVQHDPGGWRRIVPPEGSFSWIPADYVNRVDDRHGMVSTSNAAVRVGSQLGDVRDVFQRRLAKGDRIEILGEKQFATDHGVQKMYRIRPPAQEYRWILSRGLGDAQDSVAPPAPRPAASEVPVAEEPDFPMLALDSADPFTARPEEPVTPKPQAEEPPVAAQVAIAPELQQGFKQRLADIDEAYRRMIQQDAETWDLPAIAAQYRQLESDAGHTSYSRLIERRLVSMDRYTRWQKEYQGLVQLTQDTKLKDAQLLSLQTMGTAAGANVSLSRELPMQAADSLPPLPGSTPQPDPVSTQPGPAATPPAPPKFDGAGILQRTQGPAANDYPYTLFAPDSRVLAYIRPEAGVDLNPWVGYPLGLVGRRKHVPEIQADVITVRSAHPVQLRSGR